MSLIPHDRPLSDQHIHDSWWRARRLNMNQGSLSKRLAGAICDDLEAAGVTELDIDRIERNADK